jgi:hypothetical protein
MPWRQEAKKDVVSCDKLGGAAHEHYIPRFPNGTTRYVEDISLEREPTRRTETSKYPEEKKITNDSPSSGERTGKSPNRSGVLLRGCRTVFRKTHQVEASGKLHHSGWKSRKQKLCWTYSILSRAGPEESCLKLPVPSGKAKYSLSIDSGPVP